MILDNKLTVQSWLRSKHGFKTLGTGMYSAVMCKPGSDRVLKIGTCSTWEPYVLWATRQGYAGTFAPKVYSFHQRRGYYLASMERLDNTVVNVDDLLARKLANLAWSNDGLEELEPRYPGITCFVKQVKHAGFCGDWHGQNWMTKVDRIVLIDPESNETADAGKRWIATGPVVVSQERGRVT